MDNLKDILSSLTAEDIENLKSVAANVFGEPAPAKPQSAPPQGELPLSPEMLMKITAVMQRMNGADGGERVRLIEALKPNLSRQRQKKADEAMRILKVLELLPLISELNLNQSGDADAGI